MYDIHLGSYKVSSIPEGLKLVLWVRTEMTSWAGGYEPYFHLLSWSLEGGSQSSTKHSVLYVCSPVFSGFRDEDSVSTRSNCLSWVPLYGVKEVEAVLTKA